jgi:putative tryptophan/tyrosine transport system substrate-binding protein
MRRRTFIAMLGGAIALTPRLTKAHQPDRARRISVIMAIGSDDPLRKIYTEALMEGLRSADWVEGRNITMDYRWADGSAERAKTLAKDIVASGPDVIIAHTTPVTSALVSETTAIPIIFVTVTEPVTQGFARSDARPGGNLTGFSNFEFSMGSKWLQILKEIAPGTTQVAVLFNPDTAPGRGEIFLRSVEVNAASLGIMISPAPVRDPAGIEAAIGTVSKKAHPGLIVPPDIFLTVNRATIIRSAEEQRVPTIYQYDYFTRSGGLVSYGADVPDLFRRAAAYVDRVLKGAKVGDLPVQAPTKFQLTVNLRAARTLGLSIPESLLLRCDEVIE